MSRPSRCIRRSVAAGKRLGHLYTSAIIVNGIEHIMCSWCGREQGL